LVPNHQPLEQEIKRTFRYFDFFHHALNAREVWQYTRMEAQPEEVEDVLRAMQARGQVVEAQGFYALDEQALRNRIDYLSLNARRLETAHKVGALIQRFPFVRGVYLSGSLSKAGMQSKEDDLDFFILTAQNKVWTAKFFLILFKKTVLFNSEKYFCINMLMDETAMEVKKQNIYTATEIASLVPLTHRQQGQRFLAENAWIKQYLPNTPLTDPEPEKLMRFSWIERLIDTLGGATFERWCQQQFTRHMLRKIQPAKGTYQAEQHLSAFFPHSVERLLLQHYDNNPS
jgi:hypothetical protein